MRFRVAKVMADKAIIVLLIVVGYPGVAHSQSRLDPQQAVKYELAVDLARQGKHVEGLKILAELLIIAPNDYPLRRDYIIILAWAERCEDALRQYQLIKDHPKPEPYLIVPVSECMASREDYQNAVELLRRGKSHWPEDEDLNTALQQMEAKLALVSRSVFEATLGTNESDQGYREWMAGFTYSQKIADDARAYVRSFTVRGDDEQFDTGDLDRVGVGIQYGPSHDVLLTQEFSTDVNESGQTGSTTGMRYTPNDQVGYSFEYATYAEDLPLRAKAQGTDASRVSLSGYYHSKNYKYEHGVGLSRYNFSDGNDRVTFYAESAYAFELKPEREQRVVLELYHSNNSEQDTAENPIAYYNPNSDYTVTAAHKTDFVYESRFSRHVDHLYLFVGKYYQQGFESKGVWGVRFQQEYDFDALNSLVAEVAWSSNVYDGERESISAFVITFNRKL